MKCMTVTATDWFRFWFDTSFYHQLYSGRDIKEAREFVNELLAELNPAPQSCMLDLGCGKGRHSYRLAEAGHDVTGVDLSASSIKEAKKWESPNLRFLRHDMRLPFGNNQFDFVFNLFTSFGYFNTMDEHLSVIRNVSASLKPGGILVLDYINAPYAERKLIPAETKEIDGIIYNIKRWTDESHFFKSISIENVQFPVPCQFTEQVAKFTLADFESMFNKNSLYLEQVYGNYKLEEYDPLDTPRLIVIARKLQPEK